MDKIHWCLSKEQGIELVKPSNNVSRLYLKKSLESLKALEQVEAKSWKMITAYYAMYFALYSVMRKIGVKCEIHDCSLEFMGVFLKDFFDESDVKLIHMARDARQDMQYYVDKDISEERFDMILYYVKDFVKKSEGIASSLRQEEISTIRLNLQKFQSLQG
ncbi:MAG: hypothetical protein ACP5OA_01895 [Candidatus Woesearchaeota archaeon]